MIIPARNREPLGFFRYDPASARARQAILDIGPPQHSDDYLDFGYDYYDNPHSPAGYHGYDYDGRYRTSAERMVEHYRLKRGSTVFEVGCAKGFLLVEFQKLGMIVLGIDASKYAIEHAHPDVQSFVKNLPLLAGMNIGRPDLVISKEVLPHMPQSFILQAVRVMAPAKNGYLMLQSGRNDAELQAMRDWDGTQMTIQPPQWWEWVLHEAGWKHDYEFKVLFPQ